MRSHVSDHICPQPEPVQATASVEQRGHRTYGKSHQQKRTLQNESLTWLESDYTALGSFIFVCDTQHINPDFLRERLLKKYGVGHGTAESEGRSRPFQEANMKLRRRGLLRFCEVYQETKVDSAHRVWERAGTANGFPAGRGKGIQCPPACIGGASEEQVPSMRSDG